MEIEQQLPLGFDVSATGGYNTPWIYLQGKGGENFYYSLRIDKSFSHKPLSLWIDANSFIPIHYTNRSETTSDGYYSLILSRSYHTEFSVGIRWRFGRLKAESKEVNKSIQHNDVKYDYDE